MGSSESLSDGILIYFYFCCFTFPFCVRKILFDGPATCSLLMLIDSYAPLMDDLRVLFLWTQCWDGTEQCHVFFRVVFGEVENLKPFMSHPVLVSQPCSPMRHQPWIWAQLPSFVCWSQTSKSPWRRQISSRMAAPPQLWANVFQGHSGYCMRMQGMCICKCVYVY